MSKKATKRIENKDDYENSSFKDVIDDMEDTRNKGLKSLPKITKEQVPNGEETSNGILYGKDVDNDDNG